MAKGAAMALEEEVQGLRRSLEDLYHEFETRRLLVQGREQFAPLKRPFLQLTYKECGEESAWRSARDLVRLHIDWK
jgi:hypothetical protein